MEEKKKWSAGSLLGDYSFIWIFIALFIVYISVSKGVTWTGITNILRHSAVIGIISFGVGCVIVTGEFDLSVGSMLGFVAGISCIVFNRTDSILLTLIFAAVFGTLLGFLNGFMIGKLKMASFIVTLATMLIFRSLGQFICNKLPNAIKGTGGNTFRLLETDAKQAMYNFVNGKFVSIPVTGIVFILVAIVFIYIANCTKYGRKLYAIGSNEKAAHMAGVQVSWNRAFVFTIAGLCVGISAFMWLCMNGSVDPATTGKSNEMYAIAAVVLGGLSMSGGKGKFQGILFGALSYTVIDKIIAAVNVDSLINDAIKGIILIIAIMIQVVVPGMKKKKDER